MKLDGSPSVRERGDHLITSRLVTFLPLGKYRKLGRYERTLRNLATADVQNGRTWLERSEELRHLLAFCLRRLGVRGRKKNPIQSLEETEISMKPLLSFVAILTLVAGPILAEGLQPVSPGSLVHWLEVSGRCPTFSWTAAQVAELELVVYPVAETSGSNESAPVFVVALPGSAQVWTPSLDKCLEPGERYAWSQTDESVVAVDALVGLAPASLAGGRNGSRSESSLIWWFLAALGIVGISWGAMRRRRLGNLIPNAR